MKTININGREIKTNMGGHYSVRDGNDTKNGVVMIGRWGETEEDMLKRFAEYGYKRVTFCYSATRVKGYYDLYALCYR